jgi:hypothetical protein
MKILHDTIPTILSDTDDKNIYCYHYFPWWFLGGQKVIVQDLHIFKCGLKSYNDFFHTNFTEDVVIKNKMCIGNTFVISSALFEKMMSWMVQYYVNDKIFTFCGFKKFHPHNDDSTLRVAYEKNADKIMVSQHLRIACIEASQVFEKIYKMF